MVKTIPIFVLLWRTHFDLGALISFFFLFFFGRPVYRILFCFTYTLLEILRRSLKVPEIKFLKNVGVLDSFIQKKIYYGYSVVFPWFHCLQIDWSISSSVLLNCIFVWWDNVINHEQKIREVIDCCTDKGGCSTFQESVWF